MLSSCLLVVSCATPTSKLISSADTQKTTLALNGDSKSQSTISFTASTLNITPKDIANALINAGIPIDPQSFTSSQVLRNGCLVSIDFIEPNFQYIDPATNSKTNLSYGGFIGQWPDEQSVQAELAELKNMGDKWYFQNGLDVIVLAQCATADQAAKYQQAFMALHS
jgi:hypothetical protein